MSALLDGLREWGCDVEGALERFLGDEELYQVCLHTVVDDPAFAGIGAALTEGRVEAAFEHAHTLKGVLANMGLTPMVDLTAALVQPLRAGSTDNLMPVYEALMRANEELRKRIGVNVSGEELWEHIGGNGQ